MAGIISSLRKLVVFIVLVVVLAGITVAFFELFVVDATNLSDPLDLIGDISIVFAFMIIAIYLITHVKRLLSPHVGVQAATIAQYLLVGLAVTVTMFVILGFFGVTLSALLTSAGIISVTVGLIISTFVGGILSGALVFTTYKFKIGDDVMVNNMPGKVSDMTALVMRIRTDMGQITIPNSAIASGGVIVTAVVPPLERQESRLPYSVGDRVATTFRNEEGIITGVTAFHTTILLDSGKEMTFINNSIFTGAVVVAKIVDHKPPS